MIYTILGALAIVAMLLGFATSTAVAQEALPGKVILNSITGDIIVEGETYNVTAYLAIQEDNGRHQVVLDVNSPEITPPWSHQVDLGIELEAVNVMLDTTNNIVTTLGENGDEMQRFQIEQHVEEWRAEYPLRLTEIRLDDDGDTFEYRTFEEEGGTVISQNNTFCAGKNLGISLVSFDVGLHLVVYRTDNVVAWDNRLIVEPSKGFKIDECTIELQADDGRTLIYQIFPWTVPGDPNAQWKLEFKEVKVHKLYTPFRLSITDSSGKYTLTCQKETHEDGSFTLFCPAQGVGH